MTSYQEKLCHNYHELTMPERQRYIGTDREGFSISDRFFFEGCLSIPGQMYMADRKGLYDAIIKYEPAHCLEIGTGSGGGSTFFLANAFAKLGRGKVITLEKAEHPTEIKNFRWVLPEFLAFVEFLTGSEPVLFMPFIEDNGGIVECVFLDGSDISEETVAQYEFFKPLFRPGSVLMAHDWGSEKTRQLKPIIEGDPSWVIEIQLEAPESAGLVVARFLPEM